MGGLGVKFDEWRGKNSEKLMAEILDENTDILTSAKRRENACKTIKSREIWNFFDRFGVKNNILVSPPKRCLFVKRGVF